MSNQTKNMSVISLACRVEWLASAGARLTIDNAQTADDWIEAAPGIQAIFEAIEGAAADLYERLNSKPENGARAG